MGFWDKINNFKNQLDAVESNIYTTRRDFMEVYEKNIQLEAEIKERTAELEVANRRLVTVQHIWEMMNSSQPLANVLDSIVNSLQGELGYLFSCIIQKKIDNKGAYLEILADSKCDFADDITSIIGRSLYDVRLNWFQDDDIEYHILNNKIYQSRDIYDAMNIVFMDLPEKSVSKICNTTSLSSYLLIPLKSNGLHFGSLIVLSERPEATETELNFLKLFSKQIELAITIANLFQTVKSQAITDGLTGLNNRRYFEEEAQKEVLRSQRQGQKFTVIGLDLDHLKQINDKFGHSCGDIAIKSVAEVLKTNARSIDTAARMGGEEFNLLLPGVEHKGGLVAAERIRKAIADVNIDVIGHITASIGVATFGEHSDNLNELMELTDQAMYSSKKNGRNRVTLANPEELESWQDIAISSFVEILKNKKMPIDKSVSEHMNKMLDKLSLDHDALYTVSDMLSALYNPNHRKGSAKNKIIAANSLAKRFELSKEDTDKLKVAILLYDIGNMMLPKEILQKRTPLTDEETNIIKTHPIIAAKEILKPISIVQDIIPIIEHHHENWDGTGYPDNRSGQNIPLCSQMVLIIDAYFALIEPRPYRKAKTKEEAIQIIRDNIDIKWNSKIAEEFISILANDVEV
ncbi:MAG: diguanylate cyclase [Candidatus Gastranaerophilales bacterium]|nr:diguanylate cyclase [Candidatus Gastranaerophilales bacterium]